MIHLFFSFSGFLETPRKRVEKEEKKGAEIDVFSMICQVFSRKWESVFRLRRRERIEVQAPDLLALRPHFCTTFFTLFFMFFWMPWGAQIHAVKLGRR